MSSTTRGVFTFMDEIWGIGDATLWVKTECRKYFDEDEYPTQTQGEVITFQEVLHIAKAVGNGVSRRNDAMSRQELWSLPIEEEPCKSGVIRHQYQS